MNVMGMVMVMAGPAVILIMMNISLRFALSKRPKSSSILTKKEKDDDHRF